MNVTTLASYWTNQSMQWESGQFAGPCPYCNPASVDGKPVLEGTNRFHLYADGKGGECRQCAMHSRSPRGTGYYTTAQILARFGFELPEGERFEYSAPPEIIERPLGNLWEEAQVAAAHAQVDYSYWLNKYGWDREVVDRFRLGKGTVYSVDPPQHVIPMVGIERADKPKLEGYFYLATRGHDSSGKYIKKRSSGSSKPLMWIIEEDLSDKTFVITEGDTDPITAWAIGYKNIGTTFGATTWMHNKAEMIVARGYTKIIILVDGDIPGEKLAEQIEKSYFRLGITDVWRLNWAGDKRDISKILSETKNRAETRLWIENRICEARRLHLNTFASTTQAESIIVPLDELRGSGEQSLRQHVSTFIQGYDLLNRGNGAALHLQAPEGSGKTHVLIETAEKMAREQLAAYESQAQFISDEITKQEVLLENSPDDPEIAEELKHYQKMQAALKQTAVAWYGQYVHGWEDLKKTGIDESLWFNFEARNPDNCENHKLVGQLGEKFHDIGQFCITACPFFKNCKYYAQEEERIKKPITYFRHQQLQRNDDNDYKQLVVVDEYAGSVLENTPIKFKAEHVYPHRQGWELDVMSIDMAQAVIQLAQATRAAMSINAGAPQNLGDGSTNLGYMISGAAFLKILDTNCQTIAKQSLDEVLTRIDAETLHAFHPNYTSGDAVPMRCIPQLYNALIRELPDYLDNPHNQFPSCIHLVAGTLELYATERIKNRHRTPMIIADASGIGEIYQALFQRKIMQYSPVLRNPKVHTEVIMGSDWTKGAMNQQIGAALRDRKALLDKNAKYVTLEGKEFNPHDVPISAELYESAMISDALSIVKTLAERHKSLLVITHKDMKEVLESHTQALWSQNKLDHLTDAARVRWAHYGSIRGTNDYEKFDAVVLIGVYRVPYNVQYRKICMWANLLNIKETIPPDTVRVPGMIDPLHPDTTEYRTFNNAFAQRFVDMIERGEIRQSAGRIRAHSSNQEKSIYFFGSRPALPFVTHVSKKSEFMKTTQESAYNELYERMKRDYDKDKKFSSYRVLTNEFKVSNDTIKKLRRTITNELVNKTTA
jgi:5S rRNA maturation endonuclease (ribonuclease M5)